MILMYGARHNICSYSSESQFSLSTGILATSKKKANSAGKYSMKIPEQGRLRHRLHERIKELTTLYKALRVLQDSAKSSSEMLQDIVCLLPRAWQYPEITAARILFGGRAFVTPNFRASPWVQRAAIHTTAGQINGGSKVNASTA
jgi:hypothetical protein